MPAPQTHGLTHVALTVSDVDRAFTFYTDVLGFRLVTRPGPNRVLLEDGTVRLGLNAPWHELSAEELRFDEARVGLDHLAFRLDSAEELQQAAAHLDAHGVPRSEVKQLGATQMVVFRDPDNIQLEYFYVDPNANVAGAQAEE